MSFQRPQPTGQPDGGFSTTFHKTTQPLQTTGIPEGGFAPVDRSYAPLVGTGSGKFSDPASYVKPVQPQTGPVDTNTIPRPGSYLPNNDDGGVGDRNDTAYFPPTNLWNGNFDRQKKLEHYDIMPVPISGPSTEVVRPVQQANYTLPSPRWTAHSAGPVFRYTREFAQRYGNAELDGFLQNNGSHMSMAQSYGQNKWIRTKKSRTMNRNNITPRNVPTPLDDQVVNTANRSSLGTVFSSYRASTYMP